MRLVDVDALIAEYDRVHVGPPGGARKLMVDAPTVEPRRGRWIYNQLRGTVKIWTCSECGWNDLTEFNFCPNCGADMRQEEEQ